MKIKPKTCTHCGTSFEVKRFLQQFCKPACQIAHTKETTKEWGKRPVINSKPLKPSKDANTYLNARKAFLRDVRERYGCVTCERCGRDGRYATIEVHHIVYRSEKPRHEHLHSFENLMCLCLTCHEWIHENKGRRDQIVAERKLNLIFGDDVLNKSKS